MVATGNAITEDILIYYGKAFVISKHKIQNAIVFLFYDVIVSNHQIFRWLGGRLWFNVTFSDQSRIS